jgi:hypothetical protein
MTPIIIKNSKIPKLLSFFIDIYAITIWPFIIIKDEGNDITINHESIHIKQQEELWILPFYLLYALEWLKHLIEHKNNHMAYLEISFEKEAYANQKNFDYLTNRDRMTWKKYRGEDEDVHRNIS